MALVPPTPLNPGAVWPAPSERSAGHASANVVPVRPVPCGTLNPHPAGSLRHHDRDEPRDLHEAASVPVSKDGSRATVLTSRELRLRDPGHLLRRVEAYLECPPARVCGGRASSDVRKFRFLHLRCCRIQDDVVSERLVWVRAIWEAHVNGLRQTLVARWQQCPCPWDSGCDRYHLCAACRIETAIVRYQRLRGKCGPDDAELNAGAVGCVVAVVDRDADRPRRRAGSTFTLAVAMAVPPTSFVISRAPSSVLRS